MSLWCNHAVGVAAPRNCCGLGIGDARGERAVAQSTFIDCICQYRIHKHPGSQQAHPPSLSTEPLYRQATYASNSANSSKSASGTQPAAAAVSRSRTSQTPPEKAHHHQLRPLRDQFVHPQRETAEQRSKKLCGNIPFVLVILLVATPPPPISPHDAFRTDIG